MTDTRYRVSPISAPSDTTFTATWPGPAPAPAPQAAAPKDHLVIMVDDVDMSLMPAICDPYSMQESDAIDVADALYRPPMPVLDAIAAMSAKCINARAMPVCSSTRASMLTGMYPGGRVKDGSFQQGHGISAVGPLPSASTLANFGPSTIIEFGQAPHDIDAYSKMIGEEYQGELDPSGDLASDSHRVHFGMGGKWHIAHPTVDMLEAHHNVAANDLTGLTTTGWSHIGTTLGPEAKHALVFSNLEGSIPPNPIGAQTSSGADAYYNYKIQKFDFGTAEHDGSIEHVDKTYATATLGEWIVRRQFDDCLAFVAQAKTSTTGGTHSYIYHLHTSHAHNPYSKAPESLIYNPELYGSALVNAQTGSAAAALSQMGRLQAFDNELGRFLKLLAGLTETDTIQDALDILIATTNIYLLGDNGGENTIWDGMGLLGADTSDTVRTSISDAGLNYDHLDGQFKRTVFETGCRIPMLVFGPMVRTTLRGEHTRALIDVVDIAPTIMDDITGSKTALEDWYAFPGSVGSVDGHSFRSVLYNPAQDHTNHTRQWSISERYFPLGAREDASRSNLGFTYWYPTADGGDGGLYKIVRRIDPWTGGISAPGAMTASNAGEFFFHLQGPGDPQLPKLLAGDPGLLAELAALNVNSPDPWERFALGQRRNLVDDITWDAANHIPTQVEMDAYAFGLTLLDTQLSNLSSKYVEAADPGQRAEAWFTLTGQPADQDTVILIDASGVTTTFEFDDNATATGVSVLIGTDVGDTLANLKTAINLDAIEVTCLWTSEGTGTARLQSDDFLMAGNTTVTGVNGSGNLVYANLAGGRDPRTLRLALNPDLSLPYLDETGATKSIAASLDGETIPYTNELGATQLLDIKP